VCVVVAVVALGAFVLPELASAGSPAVRYATFSHTTYTNEHFIMTIGATGAYLRQLDGRALASNIYWDIERQVNGSWVPLAWTSGPTVQEEDWGSANEYHRVIVRGVMDHRIAVDVRFDGKAVDDLASGPKVSVDVQSIEGSATSSTYRMAWQFRGIQVSAFRFEQRTDKTTRVVAGPYAAYTAVRHPPMGDNSLVALDANYKTVLFGLNWNDALPYYQGATLTVVDGQPAIRVDYGPFSLGLGDRFILDPYIEGGSGRNPLPYQLYVYLVNVDRNSLAGDHATIKWSVTPRTDTCDRVDWGPTESYGHTIQLPCGIHQAYLSGLTPHTTYYYRITATKTGWVSGTYRSSFYPTDASLSKAYEAYERLTSHYNCNAKVQMDYFVETPGDISYNRFKTVSPSNYEVFDMYFHYEGSSQGGCFGSTIQTRRTRFDIWVTDSAGVIDWIAAKNHVIFSGYTGGSATVSWGINVGGALESASFGASATYTPSEGAVPYHSTVNKDDGSGTKYFGYFYIDWPQQAYVSLDAMWPIFVYDQKAQPRLFDKVTFTVTLSVYVDTFSFLGWRGNCGSGCVEQYGFSLGDGEQDGNMILDQFTNVQEGYMTAPEG